MPFIFNGIGTWYYGKRRIHTYKGTCEFCNRLSNLESYDTTLFFVVVMVPIIPLGQKRILQQCSVCQKHRIISRSKWEAAKVRDSAAVLEKLQHDPNDREAILEAIGFAIAYQDEPLFDNMVEMLVEDRKPDAAVQARLGDGYAYFARWREAEKAYRASLAAEDSEDVRELLAWALLKLGQPDEARPYLQHILDDKKAESAGMIYYLIEGYQAEGRHEEALELIDKRDEAFPDLVNLKEYKSQRKISLRYRGRDKKIHSALLADGKSGYKEGNWTSRAPYWVALLVPLLALCWYFGSAIWIGQSRKVYFVNGTNKPYAVVVQDKEYTLPPSSVTPIHIVEGELQVSFGDARLALEPIQARIETNFWERPFGGHTFIINPDQAAIVVEEEAYYAAANPPASRPPTVHFGQGFYSLPGFDYVFENFPPTLQVKGQQQIRKTRIGQEIVLTPELRLNLLQGLERGEQIKVCRKLLQIDPANTAILYWLGSRLPAQEAIDFIEPRLEDRPIKVEWHRSYQSLMERAHPEVDLKPRYRKLLAENPENPDAIYLLGRADSNLEECDKLYRQAAAATPPSGYALYGLGFRALCEARFGEACRWFEKAMPLLSDKELLEHFYYEALLANGEYDTLLAALQRASGMPGRQLRSAMLMIRVYAIRGDKAKAQQKLIEAMMLCTPPEQALLQKTFEATLCCCAKDVPGYLKAMEVPPTFEAAFLRGDFQKAANLIAPDDPNAIVDRGLLYLEGSRSKNKELAETNWKALLTDLSNGGREEKLFGEILSGSKPLAESSPLKLPIEPDKKRVLLAVLAQRNPKKADELLKFARQMDFQRDAVSLCLSKFLQKP